MAEERAVVYDEGLQVEAYRFAGIRQKFPNHFHEYYVIGFVESGRRHLECGQQSFTISTGDVVLLNPLCSHACHQLGSAPLDWRCINIKEEVMRAAVAEMGKEKSAPRFTSIVVNNEEVAAALRELHTLVMQGAEAMQKEELFYLLLQQLLCLYTAPAARQGETTGQGVQDVCQYIRENYELPLSLAMLAEVAGMNKYTLLRRFTKQHGVTPYQYLETVRVSQAKKMLEAGVTPADAAMRSGFADQSHFTRFFKNYIGLTPGQYRNIFTQGGQ